MALDLARIRALCFDVDGTLNDTDDQFVERFEPFFRPMRFLLPGQDSTRAARRFVMWSEAPGNALLGLSDTLGIDDELARLAGWLNRMRKPKLRQFRPIPGVKEMLADLHKSYPLAVVSAREVENTLAFLKESGISQYFTCVAGAQTCDHTKPFPDPIIWAAKQMGVPPEACLMIGDTTVDIRAGKKAGAQTVGVLCGFGERAELERQGADLILENTPQLAAVLQPHQP